MEGKKKYFALVLFLFLGLMIFTFANPDDESLEEVGKKKNGNETEEVTNKRKEKKDTEILDENTLDIAEDTTPVGITIRRNNVLNNNTNNAFDNSNNNVITDDSYEKALAAVVLAEKTLSNNNVNSAQLLVNSVTNNNQKQELNERLSAVKDAINAIELVQKLENMVNDASNKEAMDESRNYRTDEEIIKIVSEVTNATVKNDLQNRLNVLAKLLDDESGPVISGIDNNTFTKKEVKIEVTDDNDITIKTTLNGEEVDFTTTFTKEGTYVVTAIDKAFNETTITFTIDKTTPKITGVEDGVYYNTDVTPVIEEDNIQNVTVMYNGKKMTTYKPGDTLTKDGTYKIRVSDKAGNKVGYITFTIDKTVPTAIVTKSNNDKSTNKDVVVTIKADEEVLLPEDWTKVDNTTYQKTYSENGKYSVKMTDKAGNQTEVKFEVKRIDKVAPTAIVTKSNNDKSTNQDVVVTIKASEAIYKPEGWTEVKTNKEHEFTKTYSENGKYSVKITDKAGNQTEVKFEVKRIDKVAPTAIVTKSNNDEPTNQDVVVTIKASEAIYKPEGWTEVKTNKEHEFTKVYSENGKNSVEITDKAGNKATILFEVKNIDKIAPTIKVKSTSKGTDGIYSKIDLKLSDNVGLLAVIVNGKEYKRSNKINDLNFQNVNNYVEGENTVVLKDKAGNETMFTFTLDTTAPTIGKMQVWNATDQSNSYIRNGQEIRVLVTFSEKLRKDPIIKIAGKEAEIKNISQNGIVTYSASLVIPKDEKDLKEGLVKIEISGYEDQAGNKGETFDESSATKNITYDRTAPRMTVKKESVGENGIYSKISFTLYDNYMLAKAIVNGKEYSRSNNWNDLNFQNVNNYVEGENTVTLQDKAGNETVFKFILDRESPKAVSTTYSTTELTNENVTVTIRVSEEIKPVEGWILSEDKKAISKEFEENVNGNVTISDLAGNKVTRYYSIKNIDKKVPTAQVSYSNTELTNNSVIATLTFDEEVKIIESGTWNPNDGYATVFKKSYPQNSKQTVKFMDKAGNIGTIKVEITNIDKKAPSATVTVSDEVRSDNGKWVKFVFDEEIDIATLPQGMTKVSGEKNAYTKVYYKSGNLTVKDKVGNEAIIPFEI